MIMLEQNNKIYGSLGLADRYVMKTEEGTRLILSNPKLGSFDDVLTEFNIYGMSKQVVTTGKNLCSIKSCSCLQILLRVILFCGQNHHKFIMRSILRI